MSKTILYLLLTVGFEVFGTACIQASQQFSRLLPTIGVVVSYAASFWFLAQVLKHLPLGVVYATWSGLGILLMTAVGYLVFQQKIDTPVLVGIGLIMAGLVTINLFAEASPS